MAGISCRSSDRRKPKKCHKKPKNTEKKTENHRKKNERYLEFQIWDWFFPVFFGFFFRFFWVATPPTRYQGQIILKNPHSSSLASFQYVFCSSTIMTVMKSEHMPYFKSEQKPLIIISNCAHYFRENCTFHNGMWL